MKAYVLIEKLCEGGNSPQNTCDTVKSGDDKKTISRVAVSMTPTVDVLHKAAEWKADMLIVHEPIFFDHWDRLGNDPVSLQKKKILDESGITVFRYHDYMHFREIDGITEGELHYLGLGGSLEKIPDSVCSILTADAPITALELSHLITDRLGVVSVRIAGAKSIPSTKIALCFGDTGSVFKILSTTNAEIAIAGEVCEWRDAEYARDAAALGYNKSLIVLGHVGSERNGMMLLSEKLGRLFDDVEFKYIECDEVFTHINN